MRDKTFPDFYLNPALNNHDLHLLLGQQIAKADSLARAVVRDGFAESVADSQYQVWVLADLLEQIRSVYEKLEPACLFSRD